MCWDAVWWMGDAWYDALRCSVMNGWCMSGVMWMNERTNEWMNEWMVNKWACGQCRMTVCVLLYFICIRNMSLYLFRAILLTNKPHIHPRTSVGNSSHEPDLQHINQAMSQKLPICTQTPIWASMHRVMISYLYSRSFHSIILGKFNSHSSLVQMRAAGKSMELIKHSTVF